MSPAADVTLASSAKITDDVLNAAAQRCLAAAVRSDDRAFEYHHFKDNSTVEVRVWPDGTYTLLETTPSGTPLPAPLPELKPRALPDEE